MIPRSQAHANQTDTIGTIMNPQRQDSRGNVNHLARNRQKLQQAQEDQNQKLVEARMAKQAADDLFKMKRFANVSSKVRNEIKEREDAMEVKAIRADMQDPLESAEKIKGPGKKPAARPPMGLRGSLGSGTGIRNSSGANRQSSRLLAAGSGVIGSSQSNRGLKLSARNSSAAKDSKAPLSKDMLTQLNNYNKINTRRGSEGAGSRIAQQEKKEVVPAAVDPIERELRKRESRGELKLPNAGADVEEDKENKPSQPRAAPLPPKKAPVPAAKPHEAGKVPKYLQKYNQEAKEKKEAADAAKVERDKLRNQPAGTKVMPESDRLAMLAELQENKKKVSEMLMKMPISMQTQTMQRQKKDLEDKMIQIDKAIETMSRKNVYVRD